MNQAASPPQLEHRRARLDVVGLCVALVALAAAVLSPWAQYALIFAAILLLVLLVGLVLAAMNGGA